jgi:hypothetical protein
MLGFKILPIMLSDIILSVFETKMGRATGRGDSVEVVSLHGTCSEGETQYN